MSQNLMPIFLGETPAKPSSRNVKGDFVNLLGEMFYKIENYSSMLPFFMNLVSSSDHWLFISSSGGLTAGRVNAERALFPYYTEDKLTENHENTGSKTILRVQHDGQTWLWEPFSIRQESQYETQRNLYKNIPGTALIFEEINHSLGLTFRYAWRMSDRFGFVKTSWLINSTDSDFSVDLLDGIQNILPANAPAHIQNTLSCLLDAYKRNELEPETGLALFTLNSMLSDLAEPSESLRATTVFQLGLDPSGTLLSSSQLDRFRTGQAITPETETRGSRGAFFIQVAFKLTSGANLHWHIVADVSQDHASIIKTIKLLKSDRSALMQTIESDITLNTASLNMIVASADGLQTSASPLCTAHHYANTMFNVMRGGIFANGYWIDKTDFVDFVSTHDRKLTQTQSDFFSALPETIHVSDLHERANASSSADLIRLSYTYLPLTFSRRHGDPSRPWNRFAINIKKQDGSKQLDYEGNWRDIFQNWEALAYSYPEYLESMIFTFLGATTADGYNPYRITRAGIDWEIPEPGNPWANIGYWNDHQIIYLQKLMELSVRVHPGKLCANLDRSILSYANVPYRIKPYTELLKDPYNTIDFDYVLESAIEEHIHDHGTDGKLIYSRTGQVLHVSLTEKLLTLLLAKFASFVPEGGIWMNTQRPEWNDANNALVGKGLSVVTLSYLRRYIAFCRELYNQQEFPNFHISAEVFDLFRNIDSILQRYQNNLEKSFSNEQRREVMDALGEAGDDYRQNFYAHGFSGEQKLLAVTDLLSFLERAQLYVEQSLRANRRGGGLYHSYNILQLKNRHAGIGRLYEMLEGQVAILSSGMLSADESLLILEGLRRSSLYRSDQQTYILYPDKKLPGFLEKNLIPKDQLAGMHLPHILVKNQDQTLLVKDDNGDYHFSAGLRNEKDVWRTLENLARQSSYAEFVLAEGNAIADLFESIFRHNEFTGRSGTFFAYEGLGSIYWHMVSKLLLAVQETVLRFRGESIQDTLIEKYRDIRSGLGFNKSPDAYGAFPIDPYSHTPKGQGARQPGMTGTVKEEVITRYMELGIYIENGKLIFTPLLLDRSELIPTSSVFDYIDASGEKQSISLPLNSLGYTFCQTPIVVQIGDLNGIQVHFMDGVTQCIAGHWLDKANCDHIFQRDMKVRQLTITFVP